MAVCFCGKPLTSRDVCWGLELCVCCRQLSFGWRLQKARLALTAAWSTGYSKVYHVHIIVTYLAFHCKPEGREWRELFGHKYIRSAWWICPSVKGKEESIFIPQSYSWGCYSANQDRFFFPCPRKLGDISVTDTTDILNACIYLRQG